jgi:hypothetical protein
LLRLVVLVQVWAIVGMDIGDRRLRQLEADYAATIAAGSMKPVDSPIDCDHHVIETPELEEEFLPVPPIEGVKFSSRPESCPLSSDQVDEIKTHMKSIKLSHNPEWASGLSDAQFARVFSNVFSKDNSG